jgi:hypothetical protein
MNRRDFIAASSATLLVPRWLQPKQPVHVVVIYDDEFDQTRKGAVMACEEAKRAAVLLRREFTHSSVHVSNVNSTAVANATHLVIAHETGELLDVDAVMVNAIGSADGERAVCGSDVWHVAPLERHKRAASQNHSGGAAAWHHDLERFGAQQLNDRFRAAGIEHPAGQEWCGWMAVKCIWESSLRNQPLDRMKFDGHKGRSLFFGAQSHNLVQPIYIIRDDKVIFEWNPPEPYEDVPCASS